MIKNTYLDHPVILEQIVERVTKLGSIQAVVFFAHQMVNIIHQLFQPSLLPQIQTSINGKINTDAKQADDDKAEQRQPQGQTGAKRAGRIGQTQLHGTRTSST